MKMSKVAATPVQEGKAVNKTDNVAVKKCNIVDEIRISISDH